MKDRVHTLGREFLTISRELARVFVIVLIRPELYGVDKDRGDDDIAGLPCRTHERHMPLMQCAHRRAEADGFARLLLRHGIGLHFLDRGKNF